MIDDGQALLSGRWCSYVATTGLLHAHRWNNSASGSSCAGAGQMQRFARRTTPATESRILKLKGLPYATKEGDLQAFFQNFKLLRVALVSEPDGRPSGLVSVASLASLLDTCPDTNRRNSAACTRLLVWCLIQAFAEFESSEEAVRAMSARNGDYIGDRYVKLLRVPPEEMEEQTGGMGSGMLGSSPSGGMLGMSSGFGLQPGFPQAQGMQSQLPGQVRPTAWAQQVCVILTLVHIATELQNSSASAADAWVGCWLADQSASAADAWVGC